MRHVTFYDVETGLLHPVSVMASDDDAIELNVPPGHKAIDHPNGAMLDRLSKRVDVKTGKVIDYQPPQTSADHEWNASSKRWELKREVIAAQQTARMKSIQIRALRDSQHDYVRRIVLNAQDHTARAALQDIDAQINALEAQ